MNKRQLAGIRQICAVATASVLVVALHKVAASDDELSPEPIVFKGRPYIALGGGISQLTPGDRCPCIAIGDKNDTGVSVAIGYDFASWLTGEAYYADLGASGVEFLGEPVDDITYRTFGASVIGYLYNNRSGFFFRQQTDAMARRVGLSLYARVGAGSLRNRTEDLDLNRDYPTHVAFGAGVEYGFNNGFALRGEVLSYDTDAQFAQISVLKRFGKAVGASQARSLEPPKPVEPTVPKAAIDTGTATALADLPMPTVYFDFDKDVLKPAGIQDLDELLEQLGDADVTLQLAGHTDYYGTEVYNEGLALRRANSVRRYLVEAGFNPRNLRVEGFGEMMPATLDRSDAGRALNRRVEVTLSQ
ncbi:MAG: OmpA family protein [Gammaproteobacteria bacterium]|nr:OmpA family protein [Gammaproteobacteria bacterium]